MNSIDEISCCIGYGTYVVHQAFHQNLKPEYFLVIIIVIGSNVWGIKRKLYLFYVCISTESTPLTQRKRIILPLVSLVCHFVISASRTIFLLENEEKALVQENDFGGLTLGGFFRRFFSDIVEIDSVSDR